MLTTERELVDLAVEYGMIKGAYEYYQQQTARQSEMVIRTIKKVADEINRGH